MAAVCWYHTEESFVSQVVCSAYLECSKGSGLLRLRENCANPRQASHPLYRYYAGFLLGRG